MCLQHMELMTPNQNATKGQGVLSPQSKKLKPLTADEVQLRQR